MVTLYLVDIHLDNGVLLGVKVVGITDEDIETEADYEIVLGRNLLNRLILLLDGRNQQTDLLDRRPIKL